MKRILSLIAALSLMYLGCEEDRILITDTHNGRVPDIINLRYSVDTNASRQKVITITWGYDSVRYGTNRIQANLRDWEVYRSANDTVQMTPRGRPVFPVWVDTSPEVQPGGADSVVIYYRIYPNGYAQNNIQYVGRPTPLIRIVVKK
jgi:hypothetical protein